MPGGIHCVFGWGREGRVAPITPLTGLLWAFYLTVFLRFLHTLMKWGGYRWLPGTDNHCEGSTQTVQTDTDGSDQLPSRVGSTDG